MVALFESQPSKSATASQDLISANCCFACQDFDISSMLSFMGFSGSRDEELLQDENNHTSSRKPVSWHGAHPPLAEKPYEWISPIANKQKNYTRSRGFASKNLRKSLSSSKGSDDHPPPVIALSRSSFSTGSASSADSELETTEVDRHHEPFGRGLGRGHSYNSQVYMKEQHQHLCKHNDHVADTARSHETTMPQNIDQKRTAEDCDGVDYAYRHELLINALFEDAKHRQELRATNSNNASLSASTNSSQTGMTTPPRTPQMTRLSSTGSVAKSIASASKSIYSRRSNSSSGSNSDILSPAAHKFKTSLTSKRKIKHRITALTALNRKRKQNRNRSCSFSSMSKTGHSSHFSRGKLSKPLLPQEESSLASLTTLTHGVGDLAESFLHSHCNLQKDRGKGEEPGTDIKARGREESMAKLVEKMDLLGEVVSDSESGAESKFGTVNLTRVPAKDMTAARREELFGKDGPALDGNYTDALSEGRYIETRSMLAVKMGFMSMRYGFLVHWNKQTGLAELVVLRKMCLDSFMKVKSTKKAKSWRKRMKRMSMNMNTDGSDAYARHSAPSLINAGSNDTSCAYLDLEAVDTAPY